MKTRAILLAAFALVSSVAYADEPETSKLVVLNQNGSGVFKVIYENAVPGKVRMAIFNTRGVEIFSETLRITDGFVRPVNFKGMAHGEYTIEVTNQSGKQVRKVNYRNVSTAEFVHIARASEFKYLFTVSTTEAEHLNVRILDGDDHIVHSQELKVSGAYGVVYNLKGIAGNPTFEVTDASGKVKVIKY